ncbi:MAG: hypothetical protein ACO3A2_11755, partial [Bdellovibrionia bacterium]
DLKLANMESAEWEASLFTSQAFLSLLKHGFLCCASVTLWRPHGNKSLRSWRLTPCLTAPAKRHAFCLG